MAHFLVDLPQDLTESVFVQWKVPAVLSLNDNQQLFCDATVACILLLEILSVRRVGKVLSLILREMSCLCLTELFIKLKTKQNPGVIATSKVHCSVCQQTLPSASVTYTVDLRKGQASTTIQIVLCIPAWEQN